MTQVAEYTADTTTLQSPPVGHRIFYGHSTTGRRCAVSVSTGEIDANVTKEEWGLSEDVNPFQDRKARWQYFEDKFDTSVFPPQLQLLWIRTPQEEPVKISCEADGRIHGHEQLLKQVYAIIRDEARHKHIPPSHLEVLSDWSHEYDEHTGVVIYVEMQGTADERFALWDTIANRLEELEGSLPPNERDFR